MLDRTKKNAVMDVVGTLNLPGAYTVPEFYQQIEPFLTFDSKQAGALERLTVKTSKSGVTVFTTKFSNLKLRFKDLLLEILKVAVKLRSTQDQLAIALAVIEFLQKASGLMEYQLSETDAKVLLEMCVLTADQQPVTLDRLVAGRAGLTQSQVNSSLEILEKLACVQYDGNEIKLVETIQFVQE